MTAHPAPDSRVEKLVTSFLPVWANLPSHIARERAAEDAVAFLVRAEVAKLLVLDPKSDELVERIAEALIRAVDDNGGAVVESDMREARVVARAVVSALAAPGGEPT